MSLLKSKKIDKQKSSVFESHTVSVLRRKVVEEKNNSSDYFKGNCMAGAYIVKY